MTSRNSPVITTDSAELDAVWRAHGPAGLRYATVLVGPHDAHDICVNAFLRVSRSPGWSSIAQPRAYLMRAITNQAHDHRRQRSRQWARDLAALTPVTVAAVEPAVDIHRLIAGLSVQQRAAIYLTYWEDMTEPAIAELLGHSTGTIHRNLTRARAQLRKALS
jgi:RNA polymerase sigma factor (sigma-70 family)